MLGEDAWFLYYLLKLYQLQRLFFIELGEVINNCVYFCVSLETGSLV